MCRRQGNERGISSAPDEQGQSPAAQKHAQGPEGPSPDTSCVAAEGRPRRSSSGRGTLARQRPSAVGVLVMSSKTAVPISLCLPVPCERYYVQSVERSLLGLEEDQCLGLQEARDYLVKHRHDRPPIAFALPRPWEEGRTKVLLPSESLDTHLRTLDLDLGW